MTALRLSIAALACLASACSNAPDAPRPNVLFVSLDSVRHDDLTPYGGAGMYTGATTTPALAALAEQGVVFEQALSTTSWTLPSHMTMLTGMPDPVHGVTDNKRGLDSGVVTLAEALGEAGYATGGFYSGPNLHPIYGFSQGFDVYANKSSNHPDLAVFSDPRPGAMMPVHRASHEDVTSPDLVAAADAFITEQVAAGEPFFAFVHMWDPHYDYVAPAEHEERFVREGFARSPGGVTGTWEVDKHKRDWDATSAGDLVALYHAELSYTDAYLAKLFARLDELGIADDTLVVVVADHGEEFFEHGRWGHQRTLFDEVVRIPMILRHPAQLPGGLRVPAQVGLQDLYATICDITDVRLPAYAGPDTLFGESLRPYWEDPSLPGRDQLLHLDVPFRALELFGLRRATPDGVHKVVLDPRQVQAEVYDLQADPREANPRVVPRYTASEDPLVRAAVRLAAEAKAARAALPLVDGDVEVVLTPAERAELERLGYL